MKKTRLISLSLSGILLLAPSCSKVVEEATGNVRLAVESDTHITVVSKSELSEFTTLPQAADFSLSVIDASGNASSVDGASITLPAGNYTAKASFGDVNQEGWDKPCFSGEQNFSILGGDNTNVTINVKLANCLVRVETSEQFRNYYTDWNFTVVSGAGNAVSFVKDETRAAFFDAYLINVSGTMTGQNGKTYTFSGKEYKNLESATLYTLKFDVSNVGASSINISFNDSVEDVALGTFELNE